MNRLARIKVSTYFFLDEFIDPHTYLTAADNGLSKIDKRLFAIADKLRELKGSSMNINNWWPAYVANVDKPGTDVAKLISVIEKSGSSIWSGLRTERCAIGAPKSAHKQGKGIDPKGNGKELFKLVEANAKVFYNLGLRRLEDTSITPTWLHMDTMELDTTPNTIRVVDLKTCTKIIKI